MSGEVERGPPFTQRGSVRTQLQEKVTQFFSLPSIDGLGHILSSSRAIYCATPLSTGWLSAPWFAAPWANRPSFGARGSDQPGAVVRRIQDAPASSDRVLGFDILGVVPAEPRSGVQPGSSLVARYDDFASWYVGWVADTPPVLASSELRVLPASLEGERWLDVACGTGRMARELARRRASVVGVDLSAHMVASAQAESGSLAGQIEYVVGDIGQPSRWWDGRLFDGAACEMALMDIDDLPATLAAIAAMLRPAASFVASMVHPCFPGNQAGLSSWPPDQDYFAEGFWSSPEHNPTGVRLRVGSSHRTLATYLNATVATGFGLERVVEPIAPVPTLLVLAARRSCPVDRPPPES